MQNTHSNGKLINSLTLNSIFITNRSTVDMPLWLATFLHRWTVIFTIALMTAISQWNWHSDNRPPQASSSPFVLLFPSDPYSKEHQRTVLCLNTSRLGHWLRRSATQLTCLHVRTACLHKSSLATKSVTGLHTLFLYMWNINKMAVSHLSV